MAGAERVVLGFFSAKKSRESAVLLYCMELVAAASKDLVRVSLVADVPNQTVARSVENVMHRHRELYRTQAGAGMAADAGTSLKNELPYLIGYLLKVFDAELSKVGR